MRIGGGREGERRLKQQGEGEEVQTPASETRERG